MMKNATILFCDFLKLSLKREKSKYVSKYIIVNQDISEEGKDQKTKRENNRVEGEDWFYMICE